MFSRWRQVALYAFAAAAAELSLVFFAYWVWFAFTSPLQGPDFASTWRAARVALDAGLAHVYDPGYYGGLPFVLPPYVAPLLVPLGLLPYRVAYVVAGILNISLVAAAIAVMLRMLDLRGRAALVTTLAATSFLPVFVLVLQGQSDGLALLGLALAARSYLRGQDARAGAFATLTLVKPQQALLLPLLFVARRQWRALAAYTAVAALVVAISLPLVTVEGWRSFLALGSGYASGQTACLPIASHAGYSACALLLPLGLPRVLTLGLLGLGLAAAVAVLAARPASRNQDFALAVAASVAFSPYQNFHDLVLLLPALVLAEGPARLVAAAVYAACQLALVLGPVPEAVCVMALVAVLSSRPMVPSTARYFGSWFSFTGPAGGRSRTK